MGDGPSSVTGGVKESSLVWPMLTRSNYVEWAMLMQINYEAMEIWKVIDPRTNVKRSQDRPTLGALMRSIPREMWGTLGTKKTMKEAWETVQTMRVGADQVKEISVQKLLKEFENIEFKEGESMEDFGMRITNLVATLKSLDETVDDPHVIKNFLCVLSSYFNQVAVSIEMFCDMKTLLVEDLVGRLRTAEDRFEDKVDQITNKARRLLLAEEDWLEKHKHQFQQSGSSVKKENGGAGGQGKGKSLSNLYDTTDEIQNFEYSGLCLLAADEPPSVEEALEEECWRKATEAELQSIEENNTWMLSDLPKNHQTIGLKWVFKLKRDPDGSIVKYKARLVAKGYAQNEGWIMRRFLHQ
ncbi:uncharacterized protein [Miscanthus floridulus]|uniref:uncharacterized protein n=1 Tax=Miscanthus floridulus TaxID=154761 RepID=UPI003459D514